MIKEFDFLNYEYRPGNEIVTDHPRCIIHVEFADGVMKEINHYLGDKLVETDLNNKIGLIQFENKLERIVGTKRYVKG